VFGSRGVIVVVSIIFVIYVVCVVIVVFAVLSLSCASATFYGNLSVGSVAVGVRSLCDSEKLGYLRVLLQRR
jgi:hypothetical protein